jgi:hypothetical protein
MKVNMNWNQLHLQSRQEICHGAGISEKIADKTWEELESWMKELLADSFSRRTCGKAELTGQPA